MTTLTASGTVSVGSTVRLTATVTSGGVAVAQGRVAFDAAPSAGQLWGADSYVEPYPEPSDVVVATVGLDGAGQATADVVVTASLLPFLATAGTAIWSAQYMPFSVDGSEMFDLIYSTSQSADTVAVSPGGSADPADEPAATVTTLTYSSDSQLPDGPYGGDTVTFQAQVASGGGPVTSGQVTFTIAPVAWGLDTVPLSSSSATTLATVSLNAQGIATATLLLGTSLVEGAWTYPDAFAVADYQGAAAGPGTAARASSRSEVVDVAVHAARTVTSTIEFVSLEKPTLMYDVTFSSVEASGSVLCQVASGQAVTAVKAAGSARVRCNAPWDGTAPTTARATFTPQKSGYFSVSVAQKEVVVPPSAVALSNGNSALAQLPVGVGMPGWDQTARNIPTSLMDLIGKLPALPPTETLL